MFINSISISFGYVEWTIYPYCTYKPFKVCGGSYHYADVQLRLLSHYGLPTSSCVMAFDPVQFMLATATRDGQIKVHGAEGMQILLKSSQRSSIHFLQFFGNQGLLVSTSQQNDIEVWDTSACRIIASQSWNVDITALGVIQDSPYLYIGDACGTFTVLQHNREESKIDVTTYTITLQQVFGDTPRSYGEVSVMYALPQPSAEHERLLICYANGFCVLWALHEAEIVALRIHSKSRLEAFLGLTAEENQDEAKTLTCISWTCQKGTMFASGYNDGDVWLWSIAQTMSTSSYVEHNSYNSSSVPLSKFNLGFVGPITILRWWEKSEKEGQLCALARKKGSGVLKVVSLKDIDSLRSKHAVDLEVPEQFEDVLPIQGVTGSSNRVIMALGPDGRLYSYNVEDIYKLSNKSVESGTPVPVRPVLVECSLLGATITATNMVLLTKGGQVSDYLMQVPRVFPHFFLNQSKERNKNSFMFDCTKAQYLSNPAPDGCCLYITGHQNGCVHFWDLSTQITLLCTLQYQPNKQTSNIASDSLVSALDFCHVTGLLAIGHANGLVSLQKLNIGAQQSTITKANTGTNPGSVAWEFLSNLQTHQAPICCIIISSSWYRLAVGFETGMVSLIDLNSNTVIYDTSVAPDRASSVVSLNFISVWSRHHENSSCFKAPMLLCSKYKSVPPKRTQGIIVTTKDSQAFLLDVQNGIRLNISLLKVKSIGTAISLHVLDGTGTSLLSSTGCCRPETNLQEEPRKTSSRVQSMRDTKTSTSPNTLHELKNTSVNETRDYLLLLCCEDALRVYHMPSIIKGVCSSLFKVRLESPCMWAWTFQTPAKRAGLALVYKTGQLELRSLPNLNIAKSFTPEEVLQCRMQPNPSSINKISCTTDGQIALVKNDAELLFFSLLHEKEDFRISQYLSVGPKALTEMQVSSGVEKKKKKTLPNVFKARHVLLRGPDKRNKRAKEKLADLDQLFTGKCGSVSTSVQSSYVSNDESFSDCSHQKGSFHSSHHSNDESQSDCSTPLEMNSSHLDIDDIEIDDDDDNDPPTNSTTQVGRRKLLNTVKRNMKGKEKLRKPEFNKINGQRYELVSHPQSWDPDMSPAVGRIRTIDQIKAAYGQGREQGVTGTAAGARDKLILQRQKLHGIEERTSRMQNEAENFHNMAEELVKILEQKNKRMFF